MSRAAAERGPNRDPRPIGVFDSGVGGLTVASALMRHLPGESILYLGDTARLPYGTKSSATVARYTRRNIDFLVGRGVKAVVVACNTASSVLLAPQLEADPPSEQNQGEPSEGQPDGPEWNVPVWGVIEPGAAAAVRVARGGPIGVLATESTLASDAYGRAIRRLDGSATVIGQPCPLFVPLVEEGWHDDPIAHQVAERYLEPVIRRGVGTLVLGCTHYPLLAPTIREVADRLAERSGHGAVELVDSAESVARQVETELARLGLAAGPFDGFDGDGGSAPVHHLCVTDVADRFRRITRDLLTHFHTFGDRDVDQAISLEWVEV